MIKMERKLNKLSADDIVEAWDRSVIDFNALLKKDLRLVSVVKTKTWQKGYHIFLTEMDNYMVDRFGVKE